MKILYLMFSFSTGGMEKLVGDICNSMIKRNHNVFLCIINDLYSIDMLERLDKDIEVIKLNRKPGDNNKVKTIKYIADIIKSNKIEVVHCNGINTPEMIFLAKVLNPSLKIYYTVHDVGQYKELSKKKIIFRNIICKKIIAISECVENEIINSGALKDKVIKIYNAIDLEKYKNDFGKSKFDINNIKICNVARIIPEKKGQDLLIKAISEIRREFKGIKCYFIGEDLSNEKKHTMYLQKMSDDLGISENIYFLGKSNNVPKLLNNMDIFILPSRYEGFGLALIEAIACELPCIASDLDGPKEIIGDEKRGLLFKANDYKELTEKLRYLILNIDYYKEQSINNRKFIINNFNLKKMIIKLEDLYNN